MEKENIQITLLNGKTYLAHKYRITQIEGTAFVEYVRTGPTGPLDCISPASAVAIMEHEAESMVASGPPPVAS